MVDPKTELLTDALIRILGEHGYGILSQDQLDALNARVAELADALRAARDELSQWGWGDDHYLGHGQQDRSVKDVVASIDRVLGEL